MLCLPMHASPKKCRCEGGFTIESEDAFMRYEVQYSYLSGERCFYILILGFIALQFTSLSSGPRCDE